MMNKFPKKFGFRSILAPTKPSNIARTEKELGKQIPKAYREFLLEWNGGVFAKPEPIYMAQGEIEFFNSFHQIELLKGISFFPSYPVTLTGDGGQDAYHFDELVPPRFISIGIGVDPFIQICISTDGDDYGKVFSYYFNEGEDQVVSPILIADDFYQFWELIFEYDPDYL